MMVVGLTGGIGSGKSTVSQLFHMLGVPIFNSDEVGKRLLFEDSTVITDVKDLLGTSAYQDGLPNRKFIANEVFKDERKLKALNAIIHPAVGRAMTSWVADLDQSTPYCIKEAAILFESGASEQCDEIICVNAPDQLRIERVMDRDGVTKDQVLQRMSNQWPIRKVAESSDHVIENDGKASVIRQVLRLHNKLISQPE